MFVVTLAGCTFSVSGDRDAGVAAPDLTTGPSAPFPDRAPLTTPPQPILDLSMTTPAHDLAPPVADLALMSTSPPDLAGVVCLDGCGSMCSPCCVDSCGSTSTCNQACGKGCSCQLDCTSATTCNGSCVGGASCGITAESATTAQVDCANNANCDVTCNSVTTCQMTCHTGAHCRLRCNNSDSCTIVGCTPTTCPDGSKVCGSSC